MPGGAVLKAEARVALQALPALAARKVAEEVQLALAAAQARAEAAVAVAQT